MPLIRPSRSAAKSSADQLPVATSSTVNAAMNALASVRSLMSPMSWSGPMRLKVAAPHSSIRVLPLDGKPTRCATTSTGRYSARERIASNSPAPASSPTRALISSFIPSRASRKRIGLNGRMIAARNLR